MQQSDGPSAEQRRWRRNSLAVLACVIATCVAVVQLMPGSARLNTAVPRATIVFSDAAVLESTVPAEVQPPNVASISGSGAVVAATLARPQNADASGDVSEEQAAILNTSVSPNAIQSPSVQLPTPRQTFALCDRLTFAVNSVELTSAMRDSITHCARGLKGNPETSILLVASSAWPAQAEEASVLGTAQQRAFAVRDLLIELGVANARIQTELVLPAAEHRFSTDSAIQSADRYVEIRLGKLAK